MSRTMSLGIVKQQPRRRLDKGVERDELGVVGVLSYDVRRCWISWPYVFGQQDLELRAWRFDHDG